MLRSTKKTLGKTSLILSATALLLVFGSLSESQAQLFGRGQWRSRRPTVVTPVQRTYVQSRTPQPLTGYGSNFHRNFTIRQQQQRVQAGKPLQNRNNVLWRY